MARKTEQLIRQTAGFSGLTQTSKPVIIDEKMLAQIRASQSSDTNKVINLAKAIQGTVTEKGAVALHLISIGERAAAIRDQCEERHLTSKHAREELELLAAETIAAEKAKQDTGLDDATFPLYWELKRFAYSDPKKLARSARSAFARFPNFHSNPDEMRQLKAELYKVLLPIAQGKLMVEIAERLLKVATR